MMTYVFQAAERRAFGWRDGMTRLVQLSASSGPPRPVQVILDAKVHPRRVLTVRTPRIVMSAYGHLADICGQLPKVRFGPKADTNVSRNAAQSDSFQLIEHHLCLYEIARIKAFGEPTVDRRK